MATAAESALPVMNERFAENVFADPSLYDAVEVQGVREVACGEEGKGSSVIEVDNEHPVFYSVYAHVVAGGVECVGDHTLVGDARAFAKELAERYGWPSYDFTAPASLC
jgi:hypothetical protein